MLGRRPPVFLVLIMDNILRELEGLSRHELVFGWTASGPATCKCATPQSPPGSYNCCSFYGTWGSLSFRCQSGLKRSTTPWTRGNALVPPRKGGRIISNNRCSLYKVIFSCGPRHPLLSLTSELRAGRRLLDQVIRRMLRRVLLVALGRHRSPLASLLGIRSARILAATAEDDLVMLVLNTMTIPAMIVSSNSCILKGYLLPHGNCPFCRGVSLGATDALPNDVLYVSPMIFTFACDVSISLWLIPPPWGVGILGLRHLTLDHCA